MEEQVAWRSRWRGGAGGMEEQVAWRSRWRASSSQKERISCRMPLMRKYLAEEARGAQPAVRLGQDVWRQGAPSAAQQQHKPVLRERCRVDVRDERGADARKAHNELEVAQRGVLLIV